MKLRKGYILIIALLCAKEMLAQDPHFSQYFSSPLTVSPAMTVNTEADWRIVSNYRQQWLGPAASYNTGTISYDTRILKNNTGDNKLGAGFMLMYDESFYKIVKSTYASFDLAYKQRLDENDFHHLALGFGATYGQRNISFNELTWEEQFTSSGFNTSLPSGEKALSNMKPFLSLNTGILYSIDNYKSHLELGAALFHLNQPRQTFTDDQNQIIPARYVLHSQFDHLINETVFFNLNAVYQQQAKLDYFIFGGAIGKILKEDESTSFNLGVWYRNKDAIFPFISFYKEGWQFGLSYDVTTSKLNYAKPPKSWEISISFRKKQSDGDGRTRCPAIVR